MAESVFEPVASDWLDQFRNVFWKYGVMDKDYYQKLTTCEFCMVGDVRGKLGLSREYMCTGYNQEFLCWYCYALAKGFYEVGSEAEADTITSNYRKYRVRYLDLLRRFHKHLVKKHGVNLESASHV